MELLVAGVGHARGTVSRTKVFCFFFFKKKKRFLT